VIWGNPHGAEGYDVVLLGQAQPIRIDVDELQARLASPAYRRVQESLHTVGIDSAVDLLATYAISGAQLRPWLRNSSINRDRNLLLQYLAGSGIDTDASGSIYREILKDAAFPSDVFIGSPPMLQTLRQAIANRAK
jgi:hypothetical protein